MARDDDLRAKVEQARERLSEDQSYILEYSRAIDPQNPRDVDEKALRTVESYTDNLRRFEDKTDSTLVDLDTGDVLAAFEANGALADLGDQSLAQYQSALKGFYRWFDGAGVDPEEIAVKTTSEPAIDEQDILTSEEFHAIREAADSPRARAIIDLLGFTGQRIRIIQTLRVGDVDPDKGPTGRYWVNTEAEGTKGAEKAMQKRPLLGAQASVREWLSYHPTGGDADSLITTMPSTSRGDPGSQVAQNTIRRAINRAAEKASIDKPTNPHAFRHFFATTAIRDYDMDPEDVRRLLGHGPNSRIMETTYKHLSDDDVIADVEEDFGVDREEPENPLTPPMCPTCSRALDGHTECPSCGERFGPDSDRSEMEIVEARMAEVAVETFAERLAPFYENLLVEAAEAQDPAEIERVLSLAPDLDDLDASDLEGEGTSLADLVAPDGADDADATR